MEMLKAKMNQSGEIEVNCIEDVERMHPDNLVFVEHLYGSYCLGTAREVLNDYHQKTKAANPTMRDELGFPLY